MTRATPDPGFYPLFYVHEFTTIRADDGHEHAKALGLQDRT